MVAASATFAERLDAAIDAAGSLLCTGLDPDTSTAGSLERDVLGLIDATAEYVCAFKPNAAFFEQHGSRGWAVLERLRDAIPGDRLLILDAKRGDIGSTAAAYARAAFDTVGADAVTLSPLLGRDSVMPFLGRPGRGVFVLARTSNPGAATFLDGGAPPLHERIVTEAREWGEPGSVGFVVGATVPAVVGAVRRLAPRAPLLLPGVGAQGGDLETTVRAASPSSAAAVLPVSRGISAAPEGAAAAARALRDAINAARVA
ncbi:MAG: orotidine-5'-phosphate decarboxylase [Candidatus Dormibacteria bacterium]